MIFVRHLQKGPSKPVCKLDHEWPLYSYYEPHLGVNVLIKSKEWQCRPVNFVLFQEESNQVWRDSSLLLLGVEPPLDELDVALKVYDHETGALIL